MPSKHMLPKGKRRQSVRALYRATRDAEREPEPETPVVDLPETPVLDLPVSDVPVLDLDVPVLDLNDEPEGGIRSFTAAASASGHRLDVYLAKALPDISRSRVQLLIDSGQVRVDGAPAKPKHKLQGGEHIEIEGEPRPEPLHATPEDIPLDILYEDEYLAVIDKPAGMMVHAGAGESADARNRGTLVNALLHHMAKLSKAGGELRPGIVHRLDKQTSGAILVAKDDITHRKLGEMFAGREMEKTYIALVHGNLAKDDITVDLPIARDLIRRTRMTTRRADGRNAVSHVHVLQRLSTPYGPFTLVEVRIETGRTHQIRVHMQSLGHPVAGDTLYGAPHVLPRKDRASHPTQEEGLHLDRNFLHAAHLKFAHPRTGKVLTIDAPLPSELKHFLEHLSVTATAVR